MCCQVCCRGLIKMFRIDMICDIPLITIKLQASMPKNCSHVWLRCEVQAKVLEWYIKVAHSGLLALQLSEIIAMMTSRVPCRYHEALDARHAPCYTATALSGTATVLYPCIWWHERPLCGPCNGFDILLSSKVILPTERLLALMVIQVVAIGECTFARRCNEIWKKRTSFPENLLPMHLFIWELCTGQHWA